MKLQKFFRKYQKPMMGILGAVLIVGWLVGDAIRGLFDQRATATLATSRKYGKITSDDVAWAQSIQSLVGSLLPRYNWQRPVDDGRLPQQPLEVVDWVLLNRELEQNGFALETVAVSGQFQEGEAADYLNLVAQQRRQRKDDVLAAYAQAVGLQTFADFSACSAVPGMAEARQLGRKVLEKVKIHVVVLPAAAFQDEAATFPEEQIQAQYEAYKDNEAGVGLDFGYVLDDAVKVEYIEIDRKAIQENLKVDPVRLEREAKKYWEENKAAPVFRKPKETPKPEDSEPPEPAAEPESSKTPPAPPESKPDAPTDQPQSDAEPSAPDAGKPPEPVADDQGGPRFADTVEATMQDSNAQPPAATPAAQEEKPAQPPPQPQPGTSAGTSAQGQEPKPQDQPAPAPPKQPEPPAVQYFETWEEAREAAVNQIKQQHTMAKTQEITDWLVKRLDEPWIGIKAGPDGFKPAPDRVKEPDYYSKVVEQAVKQLGFAEALRIERTGLFTRADVPALPGIGLAMYSGGRSGFVGLAGLAFNVQGLTTVPEGADRSNYLSLLQTSHYALNAMTEGKAYLFRVVETRKSRPPQSLDEVRDKVVKDLRLKSAYEAARKKAEELLEQAKSSTLKEAYEADPALAELKDKVRFVEPQPVARELTLAQGDLANRRNVNIATVGPIKPDVAEKIFALADKQDPREAIALEERATMLVVEWQETLPARVDDFDRVRQAQGKVLASNRSRAAKAEFLRPSNVRARAEVEDAP